MELFIWSFKSSSDIEYLDLLLHKKDGIGHEM